MSQQSELRGLALLGLGPEYPALTALQGMVSPEHLKRAASPDYDSPGSAAARQEDQPATNENEAIAAAAEAAAPPELADELQPQKLDVTEATPKKQEEAAEPTPVTTPNKHLSVSPARSRMSTVSPKRATTLFDVGAGDPFRDASGVPVRDEELRLLFQTYDRDGKGYISKQEFFNEYRNFETFGLEMTDREIEQLFKKYDTSGGKADDRLSYNEFALLMLHRSKL